MSAVAKPLLRQLNIIHISDLHFGDKHRFQSPVGPIEDRPPDDGSPKLSVKFREDLSQMELHGPIILCASGDFADRAAPSVFKYT